MLDPLSSESIERTEANRPYRDFAVVIVNWNGWRDTIECLESLFRAEPPPDTVVVCDNASSDGSLDHIRAWAEARLVPFLPSHHPLRPLIHPPREQPISCIELDRETAEGGGTEDCEGKRLVLVRAGGHLGFAGANNVGLRYLLARGGDGPVWLLNPDTVVDPSAGREMSERLAADERIGICGSTVRHHGRPHVTQSLGGARHYWWLALPIHIGADQPADATLSEAQVADRMSYVYAASMMVTRRFLREIGLLDEALFLYFEELDLAVRGRRAGFALGYAPGSVVYHRGGASTVGLAGRTVDADYHFLRNRLRITRRYRPIALPGAYLALLVAIARRAGRREWRRVGVAAKVLVGG